MPESVELESVEEQIPDNESVASIKSTQAISGVHTDELDQEVPDATDNLPDEQELKPKLASFMSACQQGNLHVVKELITKKEVEASETFTDGITGLHWAAINNRLDVVEYLIENDISKLDPNVFGGELNATPLHWACRNGLVEIVDYLIKKGADPTLKDSQDYNALHLAVHSSNIMLVIYILFKCCGPNGSIYVDQPDSSNRTSLHWACYQGDILTVNALIKFGADVSKTDNSGFLPLHWSFMKAYKPLLKVLVEHGSDIFAKNDQNKTSFDVATDMNCYDMWIQVLNSVGRTEKNGWQKSAPLLDEKPSKIITFLTPYFVLPVVLKFNNFNQGFVIPKLFLTVLGLIPIAFVLKKFIITSYVPDGSLLKTPLSSGIFSGTFFWVTLSFCFQLFPALVFKGFGLFILNLLVAAVIVAIAYSFYKAMVLNPGFVPIVTDHSKITAQIDDLVKTGKFTTENFCINSLMRKPLRSKYSHYNKRLIARFDHFCPWVYNEIGVRNHKTFMFFVYSLNLGIVLYSILAFNYFKHGSHLKSRDGYDSDDEDCFIFDDELCSGFLNYNFTFNLLAWCWIQFLWLTLLSVTQTFQILKGVTTYEFSKLNSSLSQGDSRSNACSRLLGIDQFILTMKMSVLSFFNANTDHLQMNQAEIPTDYGMKQNWLDFWVLGDIKWRNVFFLPLNGENNLNGQVVDYYTLYEYPAKQAGQMV